MLPWILIKLRCQCVYQQDHDVRLPGGFCCASRIGQFDQRRWNLALDQPINHSMPLWMDIKMRVGICINICVKICVRMCTEISQDGATVLQDSLLMVRHFSFNQSACHTIGCSTNLKSHTRFRPWAYFLWRWFWFFRPCCRWWGLVGFPQGNGQRSGLTFDEYLDSFQLVVYGFELVFRHILLTTKKLKIFAFYFGLRCNSDCQTWYSLCARTLIPIEINVLTVVTLL